MRKTKRIEPGQLDVIECHVCGLLTDTGYIRDCPYCLGTGIRESKVDPDAVTTRPCDYCDGKGNYCQCEVCKSNDLPF